MRKFKQIPAFFLIAALMLSLISGVFAAASDDSLDKILNDTAKYVYDAARNPQVGSIGGEWAVMGLARSGYDVPEEYYQKYYNSLEAYVKACGGILHEKKYTEYSRVILALSSIGKDPRDVAGYNLLTPLGDYEKTIWQGLNGPVWALIALDTGNYPMPVNKSAKIQATREMYIERILECQLPDGGFSLSGGNTSGGINNSLSDPDITGMALQALAKYQDRADVRKATEKALECLSGQQSPSGGFLLWDAENSESAVQVIAALCELGISLDDARFVKNGNTLLDNLLTFYKPGKGFLHTKDGSGSNQMASEQALYALIAAQRLRDGKPSLYRMTDALNISGGYAGADPGEGLSGKHTDVRSMPITNPGITFDDISGGNYHENTPAIEALAARGIINGKSDNRFDPDAAMSRAEFAAVIVRSLGLPEKPGAAFSDVAANSWYASVVGTANAYGIVNGTSASTFTPDGAISREEAAVMTARAAKLCGLDTDMEASEIRDILAQFPDYTSVSGWARESLASCYKQEILSQDESAIKPLETVKRGEIAQMLYNMLSAANLL